MRGVGPIVLVAAVSVHGAFLLLPATRTVATPPSMSSMPDFPLVWRPIPQAPAPPQAVPKPPKLAATPDDSVAREADVPTAAPSPFDLGPVPEPVPELALSMNTAAMEAFVPDPDRPPPALEIGPPSGAVPVPSPDPPPVLVAHTLPVYPAAARALRVEGLVSLRLTVLPDGSVGAATVVACSRAGLGFEAAAQNAARHWRYEPFSGASGPRSVIVTIRFQRPQDRP